jgi:LysM domain
MSIATISPLQPAFRPGRVDRVVQAPPLRLTRRGRAVLRLLALVAVAALVVGGVLALQRAASAGEQAPAAAAVTYHVVLPGETLWGIARQVAPERDVRGTVARIIELNALPGGRVYAGQRLALQP